MGLNRHRIFLLDNDDWKLWDSGYPVASFLCSVELDSLIGKSYKQAINIAYSPVVHGHGLMAQLDVKLISTQR